MFQTSGHRHFGNVEANDQRSSPAQVLRRQIRIRRSTRQIVAGIRRRYSNRAENRHEAEGLERVEDEADIGRSPRLQSAVSAADFVHDGFLAFAGIPRDFSFIDGIV